jgi:hypothetical protein
MRAKTILLPRGMSTISGVMITALGVGALISALGT